MADLLSIQKHVGGFLHLFGGRTVTTSVATNGQMVAAVDAYSAHPERSAEDIARACGKPAVVVWNSHQGQSGAYDVYTFDQLNLSQLASNPKLTLDENGAQSDVYVTFVGNGSTALKKNLVVTK